MNRPARPTGPRRSAYVAGCAQDEFIVPLLRDAIEAALVRYAAEASPGARALDAGCGGQPFRERIRQLGYAYVSTDAQQNRDGSVDVVCAIDEPLPDALLARGPFHLIVCTEVLEHVSNWPMAFANLADLLAPGGRVLVTCPFFYPLHEEPYDFWRPTPHALEHWSNAVGLRTLAIERIGDGWDVLGTLLGASQAHPTAAGIRANATARFVTLGTRALFRLLRSRALARRVALRGGVYLANVAAFERPQPSLTRTP